MTEFFMSFEPDVPHLTHQNGVRAVHANGRTFVHKTPELVSLENLYISKMSKFVPERKMSRVSLKVCFYFACPKKEKPGWKTTKPDLDNLMKTLKDCMTRAGFWEDDADVAMMTVAKRWCDEKTERHGIYVRADEI